MRIIAEISETTRKIKLPIDRVMSVNGDYQVDGIAFKLPDTYEGDFDFRTGVPRVHWKGADGAEHAEVLASVDSSGRPIWILPTAITQGGDGVIEFSVSFSTTDTSDQLTQRWKSKPAAFRNERGIGGNDEQAEDDEIYDRLASAVAAVRAAQAEVEDTNAVLSSLTGSAPVPVENRSDMVDNGHLYLYTGDETGFVAGNLYYYVNGTLTNGGQYGSMEVDATLTQSGQAADAKVTGDEIAEIKEDLSSLSGLSEDVKQALLACFAKVAWIDEHGQDYYDALEDALYPSATLVSISAVYTQSGTVYTTDSLNTLKSDLVVTAHYSDRTSGTVTGYTLSGTLAEGTSTVTVSYGGKTAVISVTCTVKGWLYHFNQSLLSSGSEDFGWQGAENYAEGASGAGYSYWHKVETEGTPSTDAGAIYANGLAKVPDLSGDFTISYWSKSITEKRGQGISPFKIGSTSTALPTTGFGNVGNVKTGYTVSPETVNKQVEGIRLWYKGGAGFQVRLISAELTSARAYDITGFPSGFTSTAWHHYAVTRKSGTVYVFIDGEIVFTVSCNEALLFNNQVSLGGYFDGAGSTTPINNSYGNYFDDLFIAEYCKWDSDFDPAAIVY